MGALQTQFRSFKLRIVLLTTCLSGLVLVAFGLWMWMAVQRINLERVDSQIKEVGHRHLAVRQAPGHWGHVGRSLEYLYGDQEGTAYILLVKNRANVTLYQSPNWPEGIDPGQFPAPLDSVEPMGKTVPPELDISRPMPPSDSALACHNPPESRNRTADFPTGVLPSPDSDRLENRRYGNVNSGSGQDPMWSSAARCRLPANGSVKHLMQLATANVDAGKHPPPDGSKLPNSTQDGPARFRQGHPAPPGSPLPSPPPERERRRDVGLQPPPPPNGRDNASGPWARPNRPPRGAADQPGGPPGAFGGPPGEPGGPPGRPPGAPQLFTLGAPTFETIRVDGESWRVATMSNADVSLVLGFNLDRFNVEADRTRKAFLLALPVGLLLIAAGGYVLARRALRPVEAITSAAERITVKDLGQRIPAWHGDAEFQRLVDVFNAMLDRLQSSFDQASRFSADAAHELKTPVTILQGQLQEAIQAAEPGSEHQHILNGLLEETQRLKNIIRKLLILSRADAGQLKVNLEPLDLSQTVQELWEDAEILAEHLKLQVGIDPGLWVMADEDLLRQALNNLLSNAIKYTEDKGMLRLRLREDGKYVRFTIANTGKSIQASNRQHVFERFYRIDESRSRRIDGTGLGLSLATEIVRAHQGQLSLEDTPDGVVKFSITLPAMTPPL